MEEMFLCLWQSAEMNILNKTSAQWKTSYIRCSLGVSLMLIVWFRREENCFLIWAGQVHDTREAQIEFSALHMASHLPQCERDKDCEDCHRNTIGIFTVPAIVCFSCFSPAGDHWYWNQPGSKLSNTSGSIRKQVFFIVALHRFGGFFL